MTDGRERAIGGHNKPIAIRSLGRDAIGIAIHKFFATMVGNSDFDFCTTQRIGGSLCLNGNTIIRAYSCFVIYNRVEFVSKLNDR